MPLGTGAGGLLGVAIEATSGTYVAPEKFVPINSEALQAMEATQFRRPIREAADVIGAVAGDTHAEGDIEMEGLEDCIVYFLHAARADVVKGGTTPDFTYTFTPNADAIPSRTLSITVVRSEQVFAYTGCIVGSFRFGISNGMLTFGCSILARDEATQSAPTATWPDTVPFGAGTYDIEVPTGTPVTDTDTFEWTREDNATPMFRLKSTGRGAEFSTFGEGSTTLTMSRDFIDRSDYDAFRAVTAQSITLSATKGASNSIVLLTPVMFKESYEVGLSGQGDLLRAQVAYQGAIDATGKSYQIDIATQEDIVLV